MSDPFRADRFDRQRRIDGWDQDALRARRVLVCGRAWLGTFCTWGLASLGIGEILWLGSPLARTARLGSRLLSIRTGLAVYEYPFDVEYGSELGWIQPDAAIDAIVADGSDAGIHHYAALARTRRMPIHTANARGPGSFGVPSGSAASPDDDHPVTAMLGAALLVDAVRATRLLDPPAADPGPLLESAPVSVTIESCAIVGAGAIRTYAALLAAAVGLRLLVVDDDRVDASNLNRQGLFTDDDVERSAYKALATCDALAHLFPTLCCRALTCRVTPAAAADIIRGVDVVISAVDNAATRMALQHAAAALGVPLVQAGTDVFAADCVTQAPGGPLLDDQMHGALTSASERERERRSVGCSVNPSYVVPGLVAAGLAVHRALQAGAGIRGLPPMHWRAGSLPQESRHEFIVPEIDF